MRFLAHTYNQLARGARHGSRLYHRARRFGQHMDGAIQYAAHAYAGSIRPALQAGGLDTRQADKMLSTGYNHYQLMKGQTDAGIQAFDGLAKHLAGDWRYG